MSIYRLSELLDMTLVQKLAESNYRASGLPMSIIDAFDTSILVSAGWQDICTQFHRVNPLSRARCLEATTSPGSMLIAECRISINARTVFGISLPL